MDRAPRQNLAVPSVWSSLLLALFAASCGDEALPGDTSAEDTTVDVDTVPPDTGTPEVIVFDTGDPDTGDTAGPDGVDTDTAEVVASCSDPLKPFFCPCDTNSQCESSLCIAVDEDEVARRCTLTCFGDIPCPSGWECKGVGIGQEQQLICLPPVVSLCKPCERAADCQKVGALCIDFADGKFCGQDCQNAPNSCPAGYGCQEVINDLGQIDGYQCVRTSGSCNCPDGTDYLNDPENCSFCGNRCSFSGAEAGCREGGCYLKNCLNEWKDLNEVESDGCEYRCTFQGAEDWPDASCDAVNGCDQNCDGIDGDLLRGIFVSATGAANAAGTPYDPVRTIGEGLAKATPGGRDHVYVAAGTYNEVVTLKKGVSIFGGYSNDGKWTRNLALHKTQITSSTGASSIRVVIAEGIDQRTVLDGVEVLAGTNANPGGSSYAVWVKDSTEALELVRVTAIGGNGGAGRNGADGSDGSPGVVGNPGGNSSQACTGWPSCSCTDCGCDNEQTNSGAAGTGGTNQCASGRNAAGGLGGRSGCGDSGKGKKGNDSPGGAPGGAEVNGKTVGNPGTGGSAGSPGSNGRAGAAGGTVNSSGFWSGDTSEAGGSGENGVGGGGGGGGGGHDNDFWTCASWGGPGGGGGSGGCGGTAGQPGTPGGGSFGVFLYNANPTLRDSSIGHKNGGNGGRAGTGGGGGAGRDGGAGGAGCEDAKAGGKGGAGGSGGRGGHGGGGAGGIAFGLFLAGSSNPICANLSFSPPGAGGTAGLGGSSSGNRGSDGAFGDRFGSSASCP